MLAAQLGLGAWETLPSWGRGREPRFSLAGRDRSAGEEG